MPPESDVTAASPTRSRGRVRWGTVMGASALAIAALAVGGFLGNWQWDRAHRQSQATEPDPIAPIGDVMRPGESGRGEGRLVAVDGSWSDHTAVLIPGKEIDGVPAVLLVLPFTVPGNLTGTGSAGTLAVMAGWLPEGDVADAPLAGGEARLTGYVRGGEGVAPVPDQPAVDGARWLGSLSTASLAQEWPPPVYSYLVVSDEPAPGWRPLPAPAKRESLDLRSLTYSLEWWVFGAFAAILAARYIRDNGREQVNGEAAPPASAVEENP